jgi:hypothetical protein
MKYIAQPDGTFAVIDETTELFAQLSALPKERRPVFLAESSKEVKAYFAAQAQAAKPKAVTARQAHEALIRKGLADNIRNAIAGIPDPVEQAVADNWFNRSNSFERDNETLKSISKAIGLTAGDVDNLFAYAATL